MWQVELAGSSHPGPVNGEGEGFLPVFIWLCLSEGLVNVSLWLMWKQ